MDFMLIIKAFVMGVLEGATEFLPVSSTGHLILAGYLLEFEAKDNVFEIVIQTGAILAICLLYFGKLWGTLVGLPKDKTAQRFAIAVLVAFLPAAVLGAIFHEFIKTTIFSPWTVSWALIIGGVVLIFVDRIKFTAQVSSVDGITPLMALKIGLLQCFALIPGVSRSGATIVGAMLMGTDKKTAAEFSFFLAIPTLIGASVFDLSKSYGALVREDYILIAVGFAAAFVTAILTVRGLIVWLTSHGFALFGYYRIFIGTLMLALLYSRAY
jgi:undecaprenyl-diphosphatase